MRKLFMPLSCLVILHAPGGSELRIDTAHVGTIRSAEGFKHHLAPGTNTVLSVDGQNIGITEKPEEVASLIEDCKEQ